MMIGYGNDPHPLSAMLLIMFPRYLEPCTIRCQNQLTSTGSTAPQEELPPASADAESMDDEQDDFAKDESDQDLGFNSNPSTFGGCPRY